MTTTGGITSIVGTDADIAIENQSLDSNNLNRDDFLNLFIEQIKNQDPLDPMDNNEFMSQLTQFTSVEQLTNINQGMGRLIDLQNTFRETQSVDLIGKTVNVDGEIIEVTEDGFTPFGIRLNAPANVQLSIVDQSGVSQRVLDLGPMEGGTHDIAFDGKDAHGNDLKPGQYQLYLEALDDNDMPVVGNTVIEGKVTGVTFQDGEAMLTVLGQKTPANSVVSIKDPSEE